MHETAATPEPVKLLGVTGPQMRPKGTLSESVTVPLKWLNGIIVIADVDCCAMLTGVEDVADIVKS